MDSVIYIEACFQRVCYAVNCDISKKPMQEYPLVIEFKIAHEILRHDCVRIRSVLITNGLAVFCSIYFTVCSKMFPSSDGNFLIFIWCIWTTLVSCGCFVAILKARTNRRNLIARVNYLRNFLFSSICFHVNEYRDIAKFPEKVKPGSHLFLLPQALGSAGYSVISTLMLLWLLF